MADNTAKTVGLFAALLGGAALLIGRKSTPKAGAVSGAQPPKIRKGCNCGR
jgi:hypothetical protein